VAKSSVRGEGSAKALNSPLWRAHFSGWVVAWLLS